MRSFKRILLIIQYLGWELYHSTDKRGYGFNVILIYSFWVCDLILLFFVEHSLHPYVGVLHICSFPLSLSILLIPLLLYSVLKYNGVIALAVLHIKQFSTINTSLFSFKITCLFLSLLLLFIPDLDGVILPIIIFPFNS